MDIPGKVISIIAGVAVLKHCDVGLDDTLGQLGIDSMATVETIFHLEEEFDISIPFNANAPAPGERDMTTVNDIIATVEALYWAKNPG